MPVSVLILTLNEEQNITNCIRSVRWSDDIVVLDSFSCDKTVQIAESLGARVIQRPFDNWSAHQNWALENIDFKHDWVYYSDADEVVTQELRDELLSVARDSSSGEVAYWVRYKNYFWGRWIKHCGIYPVWVLRLFKPHHIRWERIVNPKPVVNGKTGRLHQHFEHYSFNKGMCEWLIKHAHYAQGEAIEAIKEIDEGSLKIREFTSPDPTTRRRALQKLSLRLPFRPLQRFIYMYVLKLGFLDGWPGFTYCRLLSMYEYMIDIQARELRKRARGDSI